MDKSKTAAIKAEKKRIEKIFIEIPENKKKLVGKLIENAAFMEVTLQELQNEVNVFGPVIRTTNGNGFDILQESPAQKSYNVMIGKYAAVIKQLENMLPTKEASAPGAELMKFLAQDET